MLLWPICSQGWNAFGVLWPWVCLLIVRKSISGLSPLNLFLLLDIYFWVSSVCWFSATVLVVCVQGGGLWCSVKLLKLEHSPGHTHRSPLRWPCLLPPRVCVNRKLDLSKAELKPRSLSVDYGVVRQHAEWLRSISSGEGLVSWITLALEGEITHAELRGSERTAW